MAEGSELEESRRLFYVALTRSKHSLFVSYPAEDKNGKEQEHSQFIYEMRQESSLSIDRKQINDDTMFDFIAAQFSSDNKPNIQLIDKTTSISYYKIYTKCYPLKQLSRLSVAVLFPKSYTCSRRQESKCHIWFGHSLGTKQVIFTHA